MRRVHAPAVVLLACASGPIAACDLLSLNGIFSNGDAGRPGGSEDASRADAAHEAADEMDVRRGDAAKDSTVQEHDAGQGVDGGFCANLDGAPVFCEDFDHDDTGLDASWPVIATPEGGTLMLSHQEFESPPNSLLFGFQDGGQSNAADVSRQFSGPFSALTVDFDLRFSADVSDAESNYYVELDMVGNGGAGVTVWIQISGNALILQQRVNQNGQTKVSSPGASTPFPAISPNTWTHLALGLSLSGGGQSTATVTVGNAPPTGPIVLDPAWQPSPVTLTIGFNNPNKPEVAASAFVDNVVLRGH